MKTLVIPVFVCLAPFACARAQDDQPSPAVIQWGASQAQMEKALANVCVNGFKTRPIDPPFLPYVETAQVQIDCDGFDFMGAPRWTEFVIGDDRLQMVWIMVEADEQETIVAALNEAYGAPSGRNGGYIAFAQNRAAWRHQPP